MIKYDELIKQARIEIPEFDAEYNRLIREDEIGEDSGVHIVFSYAFVPIAIRAIETGDKSLQEQVFRFIEEMAKSTDKLVSEVCDFTVMEELHDTIADADLLPLLGEESKMSLSAVSGYIKGTSV